MLHIIENAFKDIDAEMLEMNRRFVVETIDAMNSVDLPAGFSRLEAKHKIAGSKKMYALLSLGFNSAIDEMDKITADMIRNRNEKIVAKLKKKGIESIPSFDVVYDNGSGNGRFKAGEHNVHIETILAGGYNIQRLHQRTLCHVK